MSWEHPTKKEHKSFSSCYQVWYGNSAHEGWDMRWYHDKTYKDDGAAISRARRLSTEGKSVRVVQSYWDGENFQSEIIFIFNICVDLEQ